MGNSSDREKLHRIDPVLLERARAMRHDSAPAEAKLWSVLRNRQLAGLEFRRQHPVAGYIADFYCAETKLVIELDGESHNERESYDTRRTRVIERGGFHVIRFINDDVHQYLDGVLEAIATASGVRWEI